jgi:hypothetical protein
MKVGDLVRIKGTVDDVTTGKRPLGILIKYWDLTGWWHVLVSGQMITWPENSMEIVNGNR